jgi:UDP-glucuronate 4-epimerase
MPTARRDHVVVTGAAGFVGSLHDNLLGTQRLLEGCVRAEVPRLVLASSSSVYGDAPSYPVTEESRTRPVSPYGVTKQAAERLCQAYAGLDGSPMAVARPCSR